jgi:histidine triad (HIT) family protein
MECIFCKIINGEIPAFKIYEDENTLAFLDINPRSYGHTLVIPKRHYEDFESLPNDEITALFTTVKNIITLLSKKLDVPGFNIAINNGEVAGQVIPHIHVHIIPRYGTDNISIESAFPVLIELKDKLSEIHKKIVD